MSGPRPSAHRLRIEDTLRELLIAAGGWTDAETAIAEVRAKVNGATVDQVKRARRSIGAALRKVSMDGGWQWAMPGAPHLVAVPAEDPEPVALDPSPEDNIKKSRDRFQKRAGRAQACQCGGRTWALAATGNGEVDAVCMKCGHPHETEEEATAA